MSKQSIEKNMNVQPTLQIRPGYLFNVLVDQDMVFPTAFGQAAIRNPGAPFPHPGHAISAVNVKTRR
jgi:type IV secretion system protein VirB10